YSLVNGVCRFFSTVFHAMLVQVANLCLPAQLQVADRRDNLHTRDQDVKDHIKPDLVISRSGTAMRHIISSDLLHIISNCCSLADTLRTHREGIRGILQDIPKNKVSDT